mgnify:CR=1 FL=1
MLILMIILMMNMKNNSFSSQDIKTLKKIYEFLLSKNKFEFASLIMDIILNAN